METKFANLDTTIIPEWSQFFAAGDAWLGVLQVLKDQDMYFGWGKFYAEPTIIAFCLELYVKAIVVHEDKKFDWKKYHHDTHRIIEFYSEKIPTLKRIGEDSQLINLIKEYEKTINVKFGQMSVSIEGEDQNKLIQLIYELRKVLCKLTGLR